MYTNRAGFLRDERGLFGDEGTSTFMRNEASMGKLRARTRARVYGEPSMQ